MIPLSEGKRKKNTDKEAYEEWVNRTWGRMRLNPWRVIVHRAFVAGYRAAMRQKGRKL